MADQNDGEEELGLFDERARNMLSMRLGAELRRIARYPRTLTPNQRNAIINEAARRFENEPAPLIRPARPATYWQNLIGLAEVAEMARESRSAVSNWRARDPDFPNPIVELKCGPVFWAPEIQTYLRDRQDH